VLSSTPQHPSAAARLAELDLPGTIHFGRTAVEPPRRLPSDIRSLDALLDGGWPRGGLAEIAGGRSCGKTSLLSACLAAATRRGEIVAWVDVAGCLHPESLQQAGVDLGRLLWVRPPASNDAVRCAEILLQAGGFGVVALDFGDDFPHRLRTYVWPRLARASERTRAVCLVIAPRRLTASVAVVGLELRLRRVRWRPGLWSLLDGFDLVARLARNRFGALGETQEWRVLSDGGSDE